MFQRLHESGLLKPSKCAFFQKKVWYLGHIISRDGVTTDPEKTAKVATWQVPISKKDTQRFLGFANFYWRFIKDFAQLAWLLHRLTENTSSFGWTDKCQSSFDQLRRCLCLAPVLAYPEFEKPFILDTDASDTGIGGVFSQLDGDGRRRVIAYGIWLLITHQHHQPNVAPRGPPPQRDLRSEVPTTRPNSPGPPVWNCYVLNSGCIPNREGSCVTVVS